MADLISKRIGNENGLNFDGDKVLGSRQWEVVFVFQENSSLEIKTALK